MSDPGSTTDSFAAFAAVLWMAVIFIALGLGILVLRGVRRRLLAGDLRMDEVVSLDDLRRQRDQGLVTPTEYEAIRRQVVARFVTPSGSTGGATADKLVQTRRAS